MFTSGQQQCTYIFGALRGYVRVERRTVEGPALASFAMVCMQSVLNAECECWRTHAREYITCATRPLHARRSNHANHANVIRSGLRYCINISPDICIQNGGTPFEGNDQYNAATSAECASSSATNGTCEPCTAAASSDVVRVCMLPPPELTS
jgi:hypothetical protein